MDTIVCPYCDVKVRMTEVDDEGGACPECGAMITGSLLFDNEDDLDEEEAEFGEDEEDLSLDDDDV